jgi:hypothetical protein
MEKETFVISGRRFSNMSNTWYEQKGTFDEVIAKVLERAEVEKKAGESPDEILEVVVIKRAVVQASIEINIEETDNVSPVQNENLDV